MSHVAAYRGTHALSGVRLDSVLHVHDVTQIVFFFWFLVLIQNILLLEITWENN